MNALPFLALGVAALIAVFYGDRIVAALRRVPDPNDPNSWTVGPIQNGQRISFGTPLHPVADPDGGFRVNIPYPAQSAGSVHYITRREKPVKRSQRLRAVIDVRAIPNALVLPVGYPHGTATATPILQRRGDNWGASHVLYRWVASGATFPLTPGLHTIDIGFNDLWNAIDGPANSENSPEAFETALHEIDNIGLACGGGSGAGHGVYATAPAAICVRSFEVVDA